MDITNLKYPARLSLDKTERIIQRVEIEDTIRVLSGDMAGTEAGNMRISFHGFVPIRSDFPVVNGSVLGILLARDASHAHIVNNKTNVDVTYDRTFDRGKLAYAFDVGKYVTMGLGGEIGASPFRLSYMDGEILIKPLPTMTLGYRRTPGDLFLQLEGIYQGQYGGQKASLPLGSSNFMNETSLRYVVGEHLILYGADDMGNPSDYLIRARTSVLDNRIIAEASFKERDDRFDGTFLTPDGAPIGSLHIAARSQEARAGVSYVPTKNHMFSVHYQRNWETLTGSGESIGDVIPNLIFGQNIGLNLNFANSLSFISDQVGIGYEWKSDGGLSVRTGFQHVSLYPRGGTSSFEATIPDSSSPLLQEQEQVRLNKIIVGFLTAGAGYSWSHIQINYAFAQAIPLFVKAVSAPSQPSPPPPGGGQPSGGGTTKGWWDDFLDTFKQYQGGNTHLFELTYTF